MEAPENGFWGSRKIVHYSIYWRYVHIEVSLHLHLLTSHCIYLLQPHSQQPSSGSQGSSFVQQSQPQQSQQPPAPSVTSSAQSHQQQQQPPQSSLPKQQQTQQQSQSQPQQAPTQHQSQSGQAAASPGGTAIGGQPQGQVNNKVCLWAMPIVAYTIFWCFVYHMRNNCPILKCYLCYWYRHRFHYSYHHRDCLIICTVSKD